jgi:uncharacterized cupredoxin-like copper-binding protein
VRRALAVAAASLIAAGCGGEPPPPPSQPPGTIVFDGVTANDRGSGQIQGDRAEVEAGDFYFAPTVLLAPGSGDGDISEMPGRQVELEVSAVSGGPHNVQVPDQDVDVDVPPGDTATVLLTLPDSGTLVFWCKYHRDQGMAGAVVPS